MARLGRRASIRRTEPPTWQGLVAIAVLALACDRTRTDDDAARGVPGTAGTPSAGAGSTATSGGGSGGAGGTGGAPACEADGTCCPDAPTQNDLEPCDAPGVTCVYGGGCASDGGIGEAVVMSCEDGAWRTRYEPGAGDCPENLACPELPPTADEACEPSLTSDCFWVGDSVCPTGDGFTIVEVARCTRGETWARATLYVGDACPSCPDDLFDACEVEGMACAPTISTRCLDVDTNTYTDGTATHGAVCRDGAWVYQWLSDDC